MYTGAENTLVVNALESKIRFVSGNGIRGFGSAEEFSEEIIPSVDLVLTRPPRMEKERVGVIRMTFELGSLKHFEGLAFQNSVIQQMVLI